MLASIRQLLASKILASMPSQAILPQQQLLTEVLHSLVETTGPVQCMPLAIARIILNITLEPVYRLQGYAATKHARLTPHPPWQSTGGLCTREISSHWVNTGYWISRVM